MQRTSLDWNDARTEDGQLLCPRLFDEEQVRTMEKSLGSYGAAVQLQQQPVPREGGMFQHDWFTQIVGAPPARAQQVRYWDRAATAGGGCYYVEDVVRGQWSSWQRDQIMLHTAQADRARYPDMQPEIVVERCATTFLAMFAFPPSKNASYLRPICVLILRTIGGQRESPGESLR
ncbi:MAG TPA: hypothetical protein VK395_15860 [Gemmataceae bacterium]|nr:hypothetical protein [Gemmataceae bacterium]